MSVTGSAGEYGTVTKRQDIKEEKSHEYHCGGR